LDEFIRDALVDIVFGVQQAKLEVKDLAAIAPGRINNEDVQETTNVEFDVAVTASQNRAESGSLSWGTGGRISVVAATISGGIAGKREQSADFRNESVSRIQFKVPIRLSAHFRNDATMAAEAELLEGLLETRRKKRTSQ